MTTPIDNKSIKSADPIVFGRRDAKWAVIKALACLALTGIVVYGGRSINLSCFQGQHLSLGVLGVLPGTAFMLCCYSGVTSYLASEQAKQAKKQADAKEEVASPDKVESPVVASRDFFINKSQKTLLKIAAVVAILCIGITFYAYHRASLLRNAIPFASNNQFNNWDIVALSAWNAPPVIFGLGILIYGYLESCRKKIQYSHFCHN